jgi:hypothetical protein
VVVMLFDHYTYSILFPLAHAGGVLFIMSILSLNFYKYHNYERFFIMENKEKKQELSEKQKERRRKDRLCTISTPHDIQDYSVYDIMRDVVRFVRRLFVYRKRVLSIKKYCIESYFDCAGCELPNDSAKSIPGRYVKQTFRYQKGCCCGDGIDVTPQ